MHLLIFEPGDATRYVVGFEPLTVEQGKSLGHGEQPAAMFTFGTGGDAPLRSYSFSTVHPVSYRYFHEKMYRNEPYDSHDAHAGFYAFCECAEVSPFDPVTPLRDMRWDRGWQNQLTYVCPACDGCGRGIYSLIQCAGCAGRGRKVR